MFLSTFEKEARKVAKIEKYLYGVIAISILAIIAVFFLSSKDVAALPITPAGESSSRASAYAAEDEEFKANGIVPLESFRITGTSGYLNMIPGGSYKIDIVKTPENSNEKLIIINSNDSICEVSPDGLIKALDTGTSMLSISDQSGSVTARILIDVMKKPDTIIDVPYITQIYDYPNGCESVSTVMALNYEGIDISVDDFIDKYLDMKPLPEIGDDGELYGYSPWNYFLGDPRDYSGLCCYAPAIVKALDKFVDKDEYEVLELYDVPLETLCRDYVMGGDPVIVWATMYMGYPYEFGWEWNVIGGDDGEVFSWVAPIHCLLLIGYDDNYYYFNDPTAGEKVAYSKWDTSVAYEGLYEQAIVIRHRTEIGA